MLHNTFCITLQLVVYVEFDLFIVGISSTTITYFKEWGKSKSRNNIIGNTKRHYAMRKLKRIY